MEIFEVKDLSATEKQNTKLAVGIDFGTTNSLVSYSDKQKPILIEMVPTIIGEAFEVGKAGLSSIKRLIGKSIEEILNLPEISDDVKRGLSTDNGQVKISIGGVDRNIESLISVVVSHLKKSAEQELQQEVTSAVITVPAHFDDVTRSSIRDAAESSGLEVLRLISEPTAAALAYGLENGVEGKYLVYDLGGGTFDVSLLKMKMGIFQVLATDGSNNFGGDDIDYALSTYLRSQNSDLPKDLSIQLAKVAKEFLSQNDIWQNQEYALSLSQQILEEIVTPLITPTIEMTQSLIKNHDIEGIILVGGSTKMPLVKRLLSSIVGNIYDNIDPDQSVAFGAALQAENLTRGTGDLIIDVVPLSVGIETMGGILEKIILKNSPLPISVTEEFTTYADNQTEIQINIYQGEREMVKNTRLIGNFALSDIPPMKAGYARIEVTFAMDVDGLLTVSAYEKITGQSQQIHIRPAYGISKADVDNMVEESYQHAKDDHEERLLVESVIAANREIDSLLRAFEETPSISSNSDIGKIQHQIEVLRNALESNVRESILEETSLLNNISEKYREDRLNYILSKSLKGKEV